MSRGLEPDWNPGPEDQFSWQMAGYVPIGETYASGYVNFDPDSPGTRFEHADFAGYDFLPEADQVVLKVMTSDGDTYYARFAGPFDDLDDLYDAILDWWEEGS